jgi:hypothetical protein
MNLREAAQKALDEWRDDPGSVRMASLMMKLQAALEQPEHSPDCALLKIPSRDCDCQPDPERPGDPCEDRSFCDHRSHCRAHQKCWYTEEPDAQDH